LIDGNTVTGNASEGIRVQGSSNATITNNKVQSNTTYGVHILEGSSARIGFTDASTAAGNLIEHNGADGIQVIHGSSARLYGNTIQNNGLLGGYEGIDVENDSTVMLIGLNTVTANTGPGIHVNRSSSLRAGGGDTGITPNTNEISNNNGGGIFAEQNSSVDLRDGVTITNNQYNPDWPGFGLFLRQGSQLRIQDTTVSGNAQGGIFLFMGSTAFFKGGNNISGNTGYDLQCQNGAGSSYWVGSGGTAPVTIAPTCTSF
jgi:parallel beta-helix repeat protein